MWAFFERDGARSKGGAALLRACEETLADNKGVEELHHALKVDAKTRAFNKRQDTGHMQHLVIHSKVLEHHDIPHAAAVTKDVWMQNVVGTLRKKFSKTNRKTHYARLHRMPHMWSEIMGPKKWRTTSEIESRSAASAWHFLTNKFADQPVRCGLLSR